MMNIDMFLVRALYISLTLAATIIGSLYGTFSNIYKHESHFISNTCETLYKHDTFKVGVCKDDSLYLETYINHIQEEFGAD